MLGRSMPHGAGRGTARTGTARRRSAARRPGCQPAAVVARPGVASRDAAADVAQPAVGRRACAAARRPPRSMAGATSRPTQIGAGTGKDGRITKGDVLAFLSRPPPRARRRPRCAGPRDRRRARGAGDA